MKTPLLPRRMWQHSRNLIVEGELHDAMMRLRGKPPTPVLVIPLTPKVIAALHSTASRARYGQSRLAGAGYVWDEEQVGDSAATAVLEAIGITVPKRRKP